MGKFVYRMQNILEIKDKMEQQAKNEFAAENIRVLEEEEKLAMYMRKREDLESEGKKLLLADRLSILDIEENKRLVAKMQKAMQERKTQEILKEKAFDVFLQEEKAAESKEIDELTSYTHGQKNRQ